MLVIWLPRWKCSSWKQSAMSASFSSARARRISLTDRPNLERYPPEACQRPDPGAASFTRMPIVGRTPIAPGMADDRLQLGILFHHHEHPPAHLLGQQGHLDELVVLEAVADDGHIVVGHGDHRQQFRLAAGLQAEMVGPAEAQHLLHHLPLLVDLDG